MESLEKIKIKLHDFLNFCENVDTINEAIEKFKEIFDNEYIEEFKQESSPYYRSTSQKFYIKDGYGLGIETVSGPGDFMTLDNPSHRGVDLFIFSALADEYITLFAESEKDNEKKDINKLYKFNLSTKNLLDIRDDLIFKTLPDSIKNNDEIVAGRYENLKIRAEVEHEDDIQDDMISYYGGLDVEINSTEYYLYESLVKYIDDETFMKKVIPMFNKDFPEYLKEQIDYYEHGIYMIEHIDEYYEVAKLSNSIEECKTAIEEMEEIIYDCTEKKTNLQLRLDNALDEFKALKNKKYNILKVISGEKKKDDIKLKNISNQINELKNEIEKHQKSIDECRESCKSLESDIPNIKKEKEELLSKLERPFKDFTLDPEFETGLYIGYDYYMNVSLDRLKCRIDEFKDKLQELKRVKSYDKDSILLNNIIESKKTDINNIEYEY